MRKIVLANKQGTISPLAFHPKISWTIETGHRLGSEGYPSIGERSGEAST